ncbi:MAG: hypothetical protein Q8Q41_03245 [bacterium]|nr:hypothetical protein [bacterium]
MLNILRKEGLITALVLLGVFLFSLNQISDFDFFYHLKTGQYIWQTASVPLYDVFSYTAPGARWITHSWLFELGLYGLYSLSGYWGIIVFVALMGAATYALVLALGRLLGAPLPFLLLLLFPLAALSFELWVPRPQIFSYFFLVAGVLLLESFRHKADWRKLLVLELLILLWANVHASVILGIAVFLFYALLEIVKTKFAFLGAPQGKGALRGLVVAAGISPLVALINPNTYDTLLYFRAIQPVVEALGNIEWYSIMRYFSILQAKIFAGMLFAVDALVVWRLIFRKESRSIGIAGTMLGISLLPFISIRHVGYVPLMAVAASALALQSFDGVRAFLARLAGFKMNLLLVLAAAIVLVAGFARLPRESLNTHILSIGAVDFIAEQHITGPIFNMDRDGGYLIWKLWPQEKVFMDGRSEVYRGQSVKDLLAIVRKEDGWEKLVDEKYKINTFFLWYQPPLDRWMGPLVFSLLQKEFALVYWDDASIVMVRRTSQNSEVIRNYGFFVINPFVPPAQIRGVPKEVIAGEIKKALERSPDSVVLKNYATAFLGFTR